jgi:very-short-patch-repair endonuclease
MGLLDKKEIINEQINRIDQKITDFSLERTKLITEIDRLQIENYFIVNEVKYNFIQTPGYGALYKVKDTGYNSLRLASFSKDKIKLDIELNADILLALNKAQELYLEHQ